MATHTSHNNNAFNAGLKSFAEREIKAKLESVLHGVAQRIKDSVDNIFAKGDENYPIWTANLHDATGVGVYVDGRLSAYMPTKKATEPQEYEGITDIVGSEYLQNALNEATSTFASGIWFVLFSAVPYACHINAHGSSKERGFRFFELISADVQWLVEETLKNLKPIAL